MSTRKVLIVASTESDTITETRLDWGIQTVHCPGVRAARKIARGRRSNAGSATEKGGARFNFALEVSRATPSNFGCGRP